MQIRSWLHFSKMCFFVPDGLTNKPPHILKIPQMFGSHRLYNGFNNFQMPRCKHHHRCIQTRLRPVSNVSITIEGRSGLGARGRKIGFMGLRTKFSTQGHMASADAAGGSTACIPAVNHYVYILNKFR